MLLFVNNMLSLLAAGKPLDFIFKSKYFAYLQKALASNQWS